MGESGEMGLSGVVRDRNIKSAKDYDLLGKQYYLEVPFGHRFPELYNYKIHISQNRRVKCGF